MNGVRTCADELKTLQANALILHRQRNSRKHIRIRVEPHRGAAPVDMPGAGAYAPTLVDLPRGVDSASARDAAFGRAPVVDLLKTMGKFSGVALADEWHPSCSINESCGQRHQTNRRRKRKCVTIYSQP
jgi:hypothetical protein